MNNAKKMLKQVAKVFKKPITLLSCDGYNNLVKEYFKGSFIYSPKNASTIFNIMFNLDVKNKFSHLTHIEKKYVEVRKKREGEINIGSYNPYFDKIILYKHSKNNNLYNLSLDFVSNKHESKHALHHFKSLYNIHVKKSFDSEIDKMLAIFWANNDESYVNFEELITRMETFLDYFSLMQKNGTETTTEFPIPLTRETLFTIYETVSDCYTYKYSIKETTKGNFVDRFYSDYPNIPPIFDVKFCVKYFEDYYYSVRNNTFINLEVDFIKLEKELANLATKFDVNARKYFELTEKHFTCPLGKYEFRPTKNVAHTLPTLIENYSYIKDEKNELGEK